MTENRLLGYWGDPKIPTEGSAREVSYEDLVLKQLGKKVFSRAGEDIGGLVAMVRRQLEAGEAQYGSSFLTRDLSQKMQETSAKFAAYILLELEKLNYDIDEPSDEGPQHYLFEAMINMAIADLYARKAIRVLQGI